jgi:hypothetical protein
MPDALAKLSELLSIKVKDFISFDISVVMAVDIESKQLQDLSNFGTNHYVTRNFISARTRIHCFSSLRFLTFPSRGVRPAGVTQPADVNSATASG